MAAAQQSSALRDMLAVLRGLRNGVVYGAKVRFPHALVMTFLFQSGSVKNKIRNIIQATYTHSSNLGIFVAVFKAVRILMRRLRGQSGGLNTFVAGMLGGYLVFGKFNPINSQINMYILSRVILGGVRALIRTQVISEYKYAYEIYAAVCWGLVMYLFFHHEGTLQASLISSMTYLYIDSEKWPETGNPIEWLLN